ncbi:MAG: 1-phosphofructokinase family hexose kinase [Solirubrobacterales bacterium]
MPSEPQRCSLAIFAPSPILTVAIEPAGALEEVHFHAGGQGIWVARMAAGLGADVSLCVPLGGESGTVLRALLDGRGVSVLGVETAGANAAYVHDRRSGKRRVVVESPSPTLGRHEIDDLYGVAATSGLTSDVTLLTGERQDGVLPADTYGRLAADLRANGRAVLADLAREPLAAALQGGIDLLKISSEELCAEDRAVAEDLASLAPAMRALQREGADNVLVSRAAEPALLLSGERLLEVAGPRLRAVEPHGTGDAMFGALGVCIGRGMPVEAAVRFAVAAGAVNVIRHGLGSGSPREIERLIPEVEIRDVSAIGAAQRARPPLQPAPNASKNPPLPDSAGEAG